MVAKSLEVQDSIANDRDIGIVFPQDLTVSQKRSKQKIKMKFSRKSNESKETPMPERRASARLRAKHNEAEEVLLRRKEEVLENEEKSGEEVTESSNKRRKKSNGKGRVVEKEEGANKRSKKSNGKGRVAEKEEGPNKRSKKSNGKGRVSNGKGIVAEKEVASEQEAKAKVKETIRLYNKHYLQLVQVEEEEEERCSKVDKARNKAAKKGGTKKASKSKKAKLHDGLKKRANRPDLKALTEMRKNNEILYPVKRVGSIPGIEVGYQFYSRAEMVAVGFHSHWLNGIDYMGQSYTKTDNYEFPIAVSIVLSGMYEDDLDNAEDVVYTGQGGHDLNGNKRQIHGQKLERGNLALKNCVMQGVPVRVVRGHGSSRRNTGKVYTYDGLYKVVNYWSEKGLSGYTVYKFRLRRLENQPTLTTNQVYFTNGRVPNSLAEIQGLVCEDITCGKESIPIPATNLVDNPAVPPTGFEYCKSLKVAKNVKLPMNGPGCSCEDKCIDPTTCECAKRNGSDFPYVSKDYGRLIEAKDIVFECGPNCGCGPNCVNRTSQKGLRYRLEVFRTVKKGWAVRSWDFIPSGAPVCEYTGILARAEDMESVLENNYIFEIDCLQTIKGLGGRERRSQNGEIPSNLLESDDQGSESAPEFCIDAGSTGNIARFINHCCEPNLFVQCVLSTHNDLKLARVMLFAADNIPPFQELTYDYGYALDSVFDSDGKIKQMPCYCGAAGCRKRLF